MHPSHVNRLLPLLFAALLFAACGSGGGSTTVVDVPSFATDDLFLGDYGVAGLWGTQGAPEELYASWATLQVAPGSTNQIGWSNNTGVVSGGAGLAGGNIHFVHGDRRFGTQHPVTGAIRYEGGIDEEGAVAVAGFVVPSSTPSFQLYVQRGAGRTDGLLTGTYVLAGFGASVVGVNTASRWGRAQLDGAGGATMQVSSNVEGVIGPPVGLDATWSVADDGSVSWQFTGGPALTGWCTGDGELLVLCGGTTNGDEPIFLVMVRDGSGFSEDDLEPARFLVGLSQEVGGSAYTMFTGSLLHGVPGTAAVAGTTNAEGSIMGSPYDQVAVSVATDGGLTVTTPGGEVFVGGLSTSGRYGVLAGPTTPGSNPGIYVLLR